MDGVELLYPNLTLVCKVSPILFRVLSNSSYNTSPVVICVPYTEKLAEILWMANCNYHPPREIDGLDIIVVNTENENDRVLLDKVGKRRFASFSVDKVDDEVIELDDADNLFCINCPGYRENACSLHGPQCSTCYELLIALNKEYSGYRSKDYFQILCYRS